MFKLKRIELLGFKSFADRTRLAFDEGTVAVVGPNGCGKSNLSDAISWVLGEQSARSLRGERMADVIFNGTGLRPPTGMAEASLTLIDPEYGEAAAGDDSLGSASLPSSEESSALLEPGSDAYGSDGHASNGEGSNGQGPDAGERASVLRHRSGEITVTRRLFRSGESEYLINGEICRLRDIQDLFMGTGLGPESYAIIEQGRIGQILSSKPSDRRSIIEEAAGVSKFKTRKRLAEAKLESSRLNLSRITDILTEVSKQMNSLKRQAAKARRYREMHEELRSRLRVVLASRLIALENECQRRRATLAQIQQDCATAGHELEGLEREERTARASQQRLDSSAMSLRQSISQRDLEKERLLGRIDQVRDQSSNLKTRSGEAALESEALRAQLNQIEQQTLEQQRRSEEVGRDWTAAQESVRGLLARQEELAAQVASHEAQLERRRQDLLSTVSWGAELRNQLVKAEEMGLALERQLARTESERSAVGEEHRLAAGELETFTVEQRRQESTLAELTRSAEDTTAALEKARAEESTCRAELENLRHELSAASARKQALEESLARHAYTTEPVRRLLAGPIPINGHHFRPLGVLADFVEVSSGYEEVVEEFLKDALDYVVVEKREEARSGIALLKSEGSGRSTFFVTQMPSNGTGHGVADSGSNGNGVPAAEGLTPLRSLIRFEPRLGLNGDLPLPVLASAYLVEDAATAERLSAACPESHFLTRTGEHYHHRLVSGGHGKSAGPLALRRDFRELERRSLDLESLVAASESKLADLTGSASSLDRELRRVLALKLEAEKTAVVSSEKLRQLYQSLDRTQERHDLLQSEIQHLLEEHVQAAAQQDSLRADLASAVAEQTQRDQEISRIGSLVRVFRAQLDSLAHDLVAAQSRASGLEERCRSMEADGARLLAHQQDLAKRLSRLEEQCADWVREQQQLAEEDRRAQARLAEIEREQDAARKELGECQRDAQTLRSRLESVVPLIDAGRAAVDALREKRSATEVALARAESDYSHGAGQCREELKIEPAALAAELGRESSGAQGFTALAGEALRIAEQELGELKSRIESLGPVNMMALEELQEAEDRFSFLETQRQDLLASIEDTAQAIREIDLVSHEQFLEAFKAINTYFAESFVTLFGGGTGLLRLSDEADPESGVDMVAQPPGKRLQNVLLLSGGEKALAALALLIAMFRYTPSPFCVLDEVDAPLDESNVGRFTRLIRQMSRHTQFILITHSKRTMEIAKVLYGVTMEEPGVSKLVSVRFDEVQPEPVLIPA
ncbi:MAG TPA: chromosome segregation protein SMC [Terriglobia bacterium]|nr:chromosome segregation protein SMC [Terriglobia bacterium]